MTGHMKTIHDLFARKKNLTDLEIQGLLTLNPNSIRPARLQLQKLGHIRKTNDKRSNYTVYEFVENPCKPKIKLPHAVQILQQHKERLKKELKRVNDLLFKFQIGE